MVESPDMKSSLALRFLVLSSSSSSESGWTHWKCSMPDFVNLEEKLFRHVFCWYATLENLAQSTWIESTLQCQSTWSSSPCHPSDSAPPNLSSRKLQKSLEEILKIYFVQAALEFSRYIFTSCSVVLIKRKLGSHFSTLLKTYD